MPPNYIVTDPDGRYEENGIIRYIQDGEYHREDGPALIFDNGTEVWYLNGKIHREDGPAVIIHEDYELYWMYDGTQYTFDEYCIRAKMSDEDKLALVLTYGKPNCK